MRNSIFWWFLIGLMVLMDFYVFQAVKTLSLPLGNRSRQIIFILYWTISIAALVMLLILPNIHFSGQEKLVRSTFFAVIIGIFLAKLTCAVFLLIDDIRRGVTWLYQYFTLPKTSDATAVASEGITRSVFITWLGTALGGGIFGTLVYGFGNKYKYHIQQQLLTFNNLPAAFKGLKIVQISDIHSGSFTDPVAVTKGIEKILSLQPDVIFFTGDLVNNTAGEMENYISIFSRLKAPMGVYSILGNHDYGDYVSWPDEAAKKANLEQLKNIHAQMGWKLLNNEHVVLEKNNEQLVVVGVENWSNKARFPRHGNLQQAVAGTSAGQFKILLSHDPSHWEAEVLKSYPDISLMLSGHTHGMQFGVEIPGFKWSPVQYMYKQWAGLYEYQHQKLYVNRGFGFIGYPGRVGILPEITLFTLA